jgi:hypothetical protein
MNENNTSVVTVTIPLEEYWDLRTKAEANGYLMERLGQMEARFRDIEQKLWEIERTLQK